MPSKPGVRRENGSSTPVALEMRAGQISLHSDWILHGSEPNRSNRGRRGSGELPAPVIFAPEGRRWRSEPPLRVAYSQRIQESPLIGGASRKVLSATIRLPG